MAAAWLGLMCASSGASLAAAGCGRRATQADCRLIVDRSVELELKGTSETDTSAIEKQEEQIRAKLDDELKSCEGRRVTDRTISCVQAASTTQELDTCLR